MTETPLKQKILRRYLLHLFIVCYTGFLIWVSWLEAGTPRLIHLPSCLRYALYLC